MRIATVTLVLMLCATAHAEDRVKAERHFRLGEKAYQAQNFEAAAANFEEAYKHFELPEIAFSAAQAYRRQYRINPQPELVKRAVDLYRIYLNKVKTGGRVADAADALGEMQHELEKLIASGVKVSDALATEHTRIVINATLGKTTQTSTGMQEVQDSATAAPTKIVATLDGKPVQPFAPMNVRPGLHKIRVSADGYFAVERDENAAQGGTAIADIVLEPQPAKVTIATEEGARISVDGRPVETSADLPIDMVAGRHVVTILRRGREPIAREVIVTRGQQLKLDAPLTMTARRRSIPWLLTGAGIATAFTGTSLTLAILRDREGARLLVRIRAGDQPQTTETAYEDARLWRGRYSAGAWVGGGIALSLTTVALLLYFTDTPSPEGVRVEPMASTQGAGAAVSGRF